MEALGLPTCPSFARSSSTSLSPRLLASLCPSIGCSHPVPRNELAAEIESNTCPICFELMKSPEFAPIVLSPCGHTFCAKCLSHQVNSDRKKLCPYCRQKIVSSALNLSLQSLINRFVSLQDKKRFQPAQVEHDRAECSERLSVAETRCHILERELAEILTRRKSLEECLYSADTQQLLLENKKIDAKEKLKRIACEMDNITAELEAIQVKKADIQKFHGIEVAKTILVESSLRDLRTVRKQTLAWLPNL